MALRVLFGLLFGLDVITLRQIAWPRTLKTWIPLLVVGITNLAIPFFLISWGEQYIDSAVAAILDSTVPLFTIVMAHFFLEDDKMSLTKAVGLGVGFLGVIVLMSEHIGASPGSLLGQAAVIVACLFYAFSSVFIRKTTEEMPGIVRSTGPLVSATAVMWLAVLLTDRPIVLPQSGIVWTALLFLGVVGSGIAFLLCYYLIHEIGPTRTSMVAYLFPLGGVVLGVVFLHEPLTWQLVAGAALIIASLVIANRRPAAANATASLTIQHSGQPGD